MHITGQMYFSNGLVLTSWGPAPSWFFSQSFLKNGWLSVLSWSLLSDLVRIRCPGVSLPLEFHPNGMASLALSLLVHWLHKLLMKVSSLYIWIQIADSFFSCTYIVPLNWRKWMVPNLATKEHRTVAFLPVETCSSILSLLHLFANSQMCLAPMTFVSKATSYLQFGQIIEQIFPQYSCYLK